MSHTNITAALFQHVAPLLQASFRTRWHEYGWPVDAKPADISPSEDCQPSNIMRSNVCSSSLHQKPNQNKLFLNGKYIFKLVYSPWTWLSLPLRELQTRRLPLQTHDHCYRTGDVCLSEPLAGRTGMYN